MAPPDTISTFSASYSSYLLDVLSSTSLCSHNGSNKYSIRPVVYDDGSNHGNFVIVYASLPAKLPVVLYKDLVNHSMLLHECPNLKPLLTDTNLPMAEHVHKVSETRA